jgi:hypothetical protein
MRVKKWKKVCVMVLLLGLPVSGLWAQSVGDDIQQLLLDVQKLGQLKQILAQLYQEYMMLHKDYEQIKGLSQGTFSLHKAFLDGLLLVSPAVSSYPKVGDVVSKEASLVLDYQQASGYFRASGLFTPQELDGFSTNYGLYLQRGQKDVEELSLVTTDGELRMSDAERLSAIDRIDEDMTRQLTLLHGFNNGVAIQAAQRAQIFRDIGIVRALYGVGP